MMNLEAIANEKRNEAFVEKLIKDDKLMTKLALQLGYAVQAPVDKRPKDHGSAKAVQERADDPWRREVDGDAQGSKRVIRRRFNVSVPRARVLETAPTLRERSER